MSRFEALIGSTQPRSPERANRHLENTVLVYRNALLPFSETFIKEQILALARWRAILVGRQDLRQLPLDDLNVRVLGQQVGPLSRLSWKAHSMFRDVPLRVARSLAQEHASLIHAHFGTDAIDAWPLARALNLPLLVTLHGYDIYTARDWWESGQGGNRLRAYPQRLLELARKPNVQFIAVSESLREQAIRFGIPAERICVRYIGINTTKFNRGDALLSARRPQVLFVGRLVEKKGCEYLIRAMSMVQQTVPSARLVVVGDGPLREMLTILSSELGVNASFLGSLPSEQVVRKLQESSVFCLPSVTAENGDTEGFGLVLLEAQACGVPVVSSARGGSTEGLENGKTGYAFAERDSAELAVLLTRLLSDNAMLTEMSKHCREFVLGRFDLAKCTSQLEDLYDALAILRPHVD